MASMNWKAPFRIHSAATELPVPIPEIDEAQKFQIQASAVPASKPTAGGEGSAQSQPVLFRLR
jgi:hypothetical protein